MDTNKSESNYAYRDFADVLLELKLNSRLSYQQVAIKAGLSDSYLINIVKRKNLAPNDENIKKIAKALRIEPEYFYEYRLRKLIKLLNNSREHLDLFLRELELGQKKISSRSAKTGTARTRGAEKAKRKEATAG